ncbi:hypothetical protein [Tautonia marina]|uniref:hypothetical protein n=1 Tax=Tautonia marina TaxID=2653855 RepID=UPI00126079BE|nr:hypothetical protein [Tautonia marina]
MRRPEGPWYRAARNAWYATIDGRMFRLAVGKSNKHAVWMEFHRRMAERRAAPDAGPPALGTVAARYFEDLAARSSRGEVGPRTFRDYVGRVSAFIEQHALTPGRRD